MVNKQENPWKTLESEIKYNNDWIKVTEHQTVNSDGNNGIYGVVHFKNIAVGIIPLDEENNTWLVGQYRYPLNKYSWEICEGGAPIEIAPLKSAKRELLEELGIKASNWNELLQMHLSNSVSDELGIIYIAKDLSYHNPEPEDGEVLELKKIALNTAYEMVMKGEITDSLSVAGILKTKILIDQGEL
jgi:8-oxo-dGTP pyrophosphatase MutT (NUDIX family)